MMHLYYNNIIKVNIQFAKIFDNIQIHIRYTHTYIYTWIRVGVTRTVAVCRYILYSYTYILYIYTTNEPTTTCGLSLICALKHVFLFQTL